MRARVEWFGGLVEDGEDVVAVNRAAMRALGVREHPRWQGKDPEKLSAPIDAQLLISRRCGAGCAFCSVDATPDGDVMSLSEGVRTIDALADRGVFRVAFGGGEPLEHPDVFALAAHARGRGLVVTITTAGLKMTDDLARRCAVFAAVHVSWQPGGPRALRALEVLRAVHPRVGMNFLVDRQTFGAMVDAAAVVARLKLSCLQLLRLKPAGRALRSFANDDITREQERAFAAVARGIVVEQRIRLRVDCALAPVLDPRLQQRRCVSADASIAVFPDASERQCVVVGDGGPELVQLRAGHGLSGKHAWQQQQRVVAPDEGQGRDDQR